MSRTSYNIDYKEVEQLLLAQCKGTEIAAALGIHPDTLYRRVQEDKGMTFTEYARKFKAKGKNNIRVWQYEKAQAGDGGMQIWLGKNYLEQSDRARVTEERHDFDLSLLTDEELETLEQIQQNIKSRNKSRAS